MPLAYPEYMYDKENYDTNKDVQLPTKKAKSTQKQTDDLEVAEFLNHHEPLNYPQIINRQRENQNHNNQPINNHEKTAGADSLQVASTSQFGIQLSQTTDNRIRTSSVFDGSIDDVTGKQSGSGYYTEHLN